jgi:hypothetical protein
MGRPRKKPLQEGEELKAAAPPGPKKQPTEAPKKTTKKETVTKPVGKAGKIKVELLEDKGNGFKKGMIKELNAPHAQILIDKGLAKKA